MPTLTSATLTGAKKAATTPKGEIRYTVPNHAGLYLRVKSTGQKSWVYRAQIDGKLDQIGLGAFVENENAVRRVLAHVRQFNEWRAAGHRPSEKRAQMQEPDASAITVGALVQNMIDMQVAEGSVRDSTVVQYKSLIRNHIDESKLASMPVNKVTRRDVNAVVKEVRSKGLSTSATRLTSVLRSAFKIAMQDDLLMVNPADGIKNAAPTKRDRVLSDDELRWMWVAAGRMSYPFGPLVQLLMLTGQRRLEIGNMSWNEVKDGELIIPATRSKNGREHAVPLSARAQEILRGMDRYGDFVFTTLGDRPFNSYSRMTNALRKKMAEVAEDESGAPVEIERWRLHDIRRTVATGLARSGVAIHVTEAILNHVSGSMGGLVGVYQRYDYADEKAAALNVWSERLMEIVDGDRK